MPQNDPLTSSVETEPGPAWGWILAYGVLVVLIGSLALGNPLATGLATGFLLGVMLLTYGLVALISGLSSLSKRGRWIEALLGLLGVAAGGFVLFAPFAGALSLVWAIGFWLFVAGILELVSAIKGSHDRGWRFALGLRGSGCFFRYGSDTRWTVSTGGNLIGGNHDRVTFSRARGLCLGRRGDGLLCIALCAGF